MACISYRSDAGFFVDWDISAHFCVIGRTENRHFCDFHLSNGLYLNESGTNATRVGNITPSGILVGIENGVFVKTTAKKNMARSGRETTGRMEGKHFLGKNRMKIRRIGEEDVFRKKYQSVPKGGEENGH